MKVLVIEDDPLARYTVAKILTGDGYEVVTAVDGESGFAAVLEHNPDAVITDLIMPKKEGIEMILSIRRDRPTIPIIAISGGGRYVNADLLPMAQSVGADAIVAKPFEAEELLEPLRRLCLPLLGPEANAV
jgi:DNA-binding response OmpR family regulator